VEAVEGSWCIDEFLFEDVDLFCGQGYLFDEKTSLLAELPKVEFEEFLMMGETRL